MIESVLKEEHVWVDAWAWMESIFLRVRTIKNKVLMELKTGGTDPLVHKWKSFLVDFGKSFSDHVIEIWQESTDENLAISNFHRFKQNCGKVYTKLANM